MSVTLHKSSCKPANHSSRKKSHGTAKAPIDLAFFDKLGETMALAGASCCEALKHLSRTQFLQDNDLANFTIGQGLLAQTATKAFELMGGKSTDFSVETAWHGLEILRDVLVKIEQRVNATAAVGALPPPVPESMDLLRDGVKCWEKLVKDLTKVKSLRAQIEAWYHLPSSEGPSTESSANS